jgi:4-amino-4-deoxy-L-arabinose transferase-like glycosyltransferase
MPLYFLLTRQAVTDTPFVTLMVAAMACALIGIFDDETRHRSAWWYGFYVLMGFSALAKGLLAGLPAVVLLIYAGLCVMPWTSEGLQAHRDWLFDGAVRAQVRRGERPMPVLFDWMYRMRLGTGALTFFAVAAPWYVVMSMFPAVDDEGSRFFTRFFIHDHFNRLGAGVHTTTPGGSFTYFIEQGGYALFPWIALLPGALALASRLKLRGGTKEDQLGVIAFCWALVPFGLVAFSATKFHHYVFPVLPGVAVLIALFVDRLWKEGVAAHAMSLLIGLVLFGLVARDLAANPKNFTDLFVYNYDRPYPMEAVTMKAAMPFGKTLHLGHLLAVALLGLGAHQLVETFSQKDRSVLARVVAIVFFGLGASFLVALSLRGTVSVLLLSGLSLFAGAAYAGLEAALRRRLEYVLPAVVLLLAGSAAVVAGLPTATLWKLGFPQLARSSDVVLSALMQPVNVKTGLGFLFLAAGAVMAVAAMQRARTLLFGSFGLLTVLFAFWFNWHHWVELSHHWTQRDLFWRYYEQRKPDEPIAAFLMNWRGETFYSKNRVKQIRDNARMSVYASQPGREWALVEHNRLNILRTAVGVDKRVTLIDRNINNKFVLVTIE